MSVDILENATDAALRVANLRPEIQENLKAQYETATHVVGAAGWHGPLDIQTLEGLQGQFLWPEDPFNFRVITFTFDADKVGFQGTYKLAVGVFTVEEGIFHCVPNNPAIGFAFIGLVPQGGSASRTFLVSGMFTDKDWKIIIGLLNKLGPNGPIQPPFSAVRIS
ncbi:MAG TPA: hypothetical protein VGJ95_18540 [Pseudonocardiaceae bacterium]|jgi:hypothetical protein